MLTVIEKVFDSEEIAGFRARLLDAEWEDGSVSAGSRSIAVKQNLQLPEDGALSRELGALIVERLTAHPLFISAALPERIYPPRFNLYRDGGHYGTHVDGGLMYQPVARQSLRSDLSATLFIAEPDTYEGGELVIENAFGAQAVKLAAGDLILYPSSSLHQVTPVTSGLRIASFFWIQSAVKDERSRALLFDLDQSIQSLSIGRRRDDPDIDRLIAIYHNLVRRWADV